MKNLTPLLLFALAFGISPVVEAQGNDSAQPLRSIREIRPALNIDLKAAYEEQRATIEAQREKIKAEAEARRAEAESRGDQAQAQRESARVELETRRAEADARREAVRVQAEARRAEALAKRGEFQREAAVRQAANASRVILATIERLENIAVRIESRMTKVLERGGDTTESEVFLSAARRDLSNAKISAGTLTALDLSGESAQENFQRVRTAAAEAREYIRSAHQNLMMAVRSLGSVQAEIESDTSAEVEVEVE